MAARSPGTSGLALALAVAGGIVLYSGLKNATVTDTLKGVLKGQLPQATQQQTALGSAIQSAIASVNQATAGGPVGTGTQPGGLGNGIADAAHAYLGTKYVFGGHTPAGFDCSGLVTWVLHHDLGLNLPSNTHTVTTAFYVWSGATTVREPARGDLVCWSSHIGIYDGNGQMIHAPHTGDVVRIARVWTVPAPIYRRVNDQARQGISPAPVQRLSPAGG